MSDTDKLLHLSLILKAIDDCDQELIEFKAQHKARRETLQTQLNQLRWEVLSGQERLPLEGTCVTPADFAVVPTTDSPSVDVIGARTQPAGPTKISTETTIQTMTMKTPPSADAECSVEERVRTRKSRKLQGQDAILPDVRQPAPLAEDAR